MEIKWHGNTCFTLTDKGFKVVINPDKEAGKLKGDVVLSTLGKVEEVEGATKLIDWPGEYEIKGIHITGFPAWTVSKSKEEEAGAKGEETVIFYIEIDGIKCCHLGKLGHVLSSDTIKEVGDVDILMIDVGEDSNLDIKKAMEVVEAIEPRALIPMGKGDFTKALKELGENIGEIQESFTIKSPSELPEDKRACIVLNKS